MQRIENQGENKKRSVWNAFLSVIIPFGAGEGTLTPGLVLGKDAL